MKLFIVMGSTGEYSDRKEWPVCAYRSEELAEAHVKAAEAWCFEHKVSRDNPRNYAPEKYELKSPYDPEFTTDYTGTGYFVITTELREVLP